MEVAHYFRSQKQPPFDSLRLNEFRNKEAILKAENALCACNKVLGRVWDFEPTITFCIDIATVDMMRIPQQDNKSALDNPNTKMRVTYYYYGYGYFGNNFTPLAAVRSNSSSEYQIKTTSAWIVARFTYLDDTEVKLIGSANNPCIVW